MKVLFGICLSLVFFTCSNSKKEQEEPQQKTSFSVEPNFGEILDSAKVQGAILVYAAEDDKFYSNDFEWSKQGSLPASTFKIANSIIGLETGVVEGDSTIFKWDGQPKALKVWEQDLRFREAFHYSCVPCYQQIARRVGYERMTAYIQKLDYGNIQFDSSLIDRFWLEGESTITPFQQIDFLQRFYNAQLPIKERTHSIMKKLMVMEENEQYKISGKTGWAIRNGNNRGWFVGYVETNEQVYFFATNIIPKEQFNMNLFPKIRTEITYKALQALNIIPNLRLKS
jgi:beta-lactamase class D